MQKHEFVKVMTFAGFGGMLNDADDRKRQFEYVDRDTRMAIFHRVFHGILARSRRFRPMIKRDAV